MHPVGSEGTSSQSSTQGLLLQPGVQGSAKALSAPCPPALPHALCPSGAALPQRPEAQARLPFPAVSIPVSLLHLTMVSLNLDPSGWSWSPPLNTPLVYVGSRKSRDLGLWVRILAQPLSGGGVSGKPLSFSGKGDSDGTLLTVGTKLRKLGAQTMSPPTPKPCSSSAGRSSRVPTYLITRAA